MTTVPTLVRAVEAWAGDNALVRQRARALQSSGHLPTANGETRPKAKPHHLATLLLSLAAEKHRLAGTTVDRLGALVSIDALRANGTGGTCADALAQWVGDVWDGDFRAAEYDLTIDCSSDTVVLTRRHDRQVFVPAGQIVDLSKTPAIRRIVTVSGAIVASIAADLRSHR